jgi:hypothetical protein
MTGSELLLVAVAGLCPLSFLLGIACVLVLAVATGHVGKQHVKTVEGVRAADIERRSGEEVLDGWRIVAIIPVRAGQDDADGGGIRTQYNLVFRKWRLT